MPVRKPRPKGEYATMPMPSSLSVGMISSCMKLHVIILKWSSKVQVSAKRHISCSHMTAGMLK